ncbi:UNVERIFIED_CONTAM: hypothetical protein FKN15_000643 [Acipenser sinensis]
MGILLISCTLNNIYPLLVHSRSSCFAVHKNVSSFFKVWVPVKVQRFSTRVGNSHEGDDKRPNTKQKEQSGKVPHALPKSVFAAGTARKKAEFLKQKWGNDFDKELKGPRKPKENNIPSQPLTAPQWKTLKDDARASHHFEVSMMEKMLAANSDIDVAKSLLAYVAMETGTVSYELLLRYLTLCVHGNHESEVFDVYDIMKKRFKTLETGAYSLFIKGFSRTEKWRECLLLLESIKRVITPSPRNYGYAINGALLHGDSRTAWVLYEEMVEKGLTPNQETWQAFFDSDRSAHDSESKLSSLLLYMRNNQIYPGEALVKSIKAWFERYVISLFPPLSAAGGSVSPGPAEPETARSGSQAHAEGISQLGQEKHVCYSAKGRLFLHRQHTVPKYDTIIQTEENSWHIPYDEDGVERYSYEVPRKWLCLEMKR